MCSRQDIKPSFRREKRPAGVQQGAIFPIRGGTSILSEEKDEIFRLLPVCPDCGRLAVLSVELRDASRQASLPPSRAGGAASGRRKIESTIRSMVSITFSARGTVVLVK